MNLLEAFEKLRSLKTPMIRTRDCSACLKITRSHASKILERLSKTGSLIPISRGLWAFPEQLDVHTLPEYLTAPQEAYLSLHTALFHHGMISQIPEVIYAVSVARSKKVLTPVGLISIHHIVDELFFGFDMVGNQYVKIAHPEKALIDLFYFSSIQSFPYKSYPEISIPSDFNIEYANQIINKIPSKKIKSQTLKKFVQVLKN